MINELERAGFIDCGGRGSHRNYAALGGLSAMKGQRIVANIATADLEAADAFYHGVLGLDLVMDHGWLGTYASASKMTVQVSFASQGGSDTSVPELSIEVDDLAEALRRMESYEFGGTISQPSEVPYAIFFFSNRT